MIQRRKDGSYSMTKGGGLDVIRGLVVLIACIAVIPALLFPEVFVGMLGPGVAADDWRVRVIVVGLWCIPVLGVVVLVTWFVKLWREDSADVRANPNLVRVSKEISSSQRTASASTRTRLLTVLLAIAVTFLPSLALNLLPAEWAQSLPTAGWSALVLLVAGAPLLLVLAVHWIIRRRSGSDD